MNGEKYEDYKDIIYPDATEYGSLSEIPTQRLVEYVRGTLGTDHSLKTVAIVCNIYNYAVAKGFETMNLADVCSDALRIYRMDHDPLVSNELHTLLCKIPDTYHDFLWGTENNIRFNAPLQERLLNYLKTHPEATTFQVIAYVSFLNADIDSPEVLACEAIDIISNAKMKPADYLDMLRAEHVPSFLNKDWVISDVIIGEKGYTYRISRNAVFVDHLGKAIGAGFVYPSGHDSATILFAATYDDELHAEAKAELLKHLERIAKLKEKSYIIAVIHEDELAYYEKLGYKRSLGQPVRVDSKLYLRKDI